MKKRILSGTLAMAMIIALIESISIPAFADARYGFYIAKDIQLVDNVSYDKDSPEFQGTGIIANDGSIEKRGNTLILNNVTINSGENDGIDINFYSGYFTDSAIIILEGTNKIITQDGYDSIYTNGEYNGTNKPSLTIQSDSQGTLETNNRIYNYKSDLTIKNCKVTATLTAIPTQSEKYDGININKGDLSISGSTVTATGYNGIKVALGNIGITNSTVTAVGTEDGIHVKGENITISGSTVTSTGAGDGIFVGDSEKSIGTLNISNSTLTATATDNLGGSFGICSYKYITISNSTVNATGSFGMFSIDGDITAQSGKITAKSIYTGGTAILATGNINLGTGMYIKIGGNIRSNISLGNFIVSTIAEGNVTNDGTSRLAGAAKDVVICGPGTVSVQSPQKPSNISSVTLPSQTDLQNAVLTQADRDAIANGTNVNIQMVINSVQAPSDANKVQQSLGKNTLGMYLDISILKTVGDTQTAVHNLNAPIRITFTIPDNLKGKSKYYVIRVHDGVTTVLEDLDNDPNTVTFETNQFSTYALVYSAKSARTSDNSNIAALAVMAASSIGAVAFIQKKKF